MADAFKEEKEVLFELRAILHTINSLSKNLDRLNELTGDGSELRKHQDKAVESLMVWKSLFTIAASLQQSQ